MVPKVPEKYVNRENLNDIFLKSKEDVFIISSRAGMGKTMAVAQFCRERKEEVLWYTLDSQDNKEENFFHYLAQGLGNLDKNIEQEVVLSFEAQEKMGAELENVFINALLELAERKKKEQKKVCLVFDSFHCIENPVILSMVKRILEYVAGEIRVFILTSFSMQREFSRYMTQGNYRKITEKELLFSFEEIGKFAEYFFGKEEIKEEHIRKAQQLTDGWPVAAGCLFYSLEERGEDISSIMKMTEKHLLMDTVLYDYIYTELYEKFYRDEQKFLVHTSVFAEMNVSVCNHCMEREDSGKILHGLWKKHVLEPFWEKEQEYFRYFELFRLFLLEQVEKKVQRELEEKAEIYYRKENQYHKAFFYAKADGKRVSKLLETCGKRMLQENALTLIKQCADVLEKSEQELSVTQLDILAEYSYRAGNLEQMEKYLNCADSMFGKENKYGMYRSLYRALFYYHKDPEKYERQVNNVLFFLEENNIQGPYLLEKEQDILDKIKKDKKDELQKQDSKKIKVSVFGTFRAIILEDGKELAWRTKKGCELFAYLLDRNGEAVERKTLLAELWSVEIPNNAVAMLHNMFYNIRKELSYYNLEHIIQYKNKKYSMDMSLIQSDLSEIQTVCRYVEEKNAGKLIRHKHLFLTYKGRYLEDMDNEWLREKQSYYEKIFEKGCNMLAEECMVEEAYEEALVYLKNALSVSVYSEKIVCDMLHCYHKMDDLKGAKKQYEEFCLLLKNELNVEPGEQVKKSYQQCMTR